MLIAALFTTAKTCNQPKYALTDEWKKMRYIYIMEYYSVIKNYKMLFVATWMQLEIITLSQVRKRKMNTVEHHFFVEFKIWHKWTYLQNRNTFTDIENRVVVAKGDGGRIRTDWERGVSRRKQWHLEWINNKFLLYSTGNHVQSPGMNHKEKNIEKEGLYVHKVYMSHSAVQQRLTQHCVSTIIQ